MVSVLHKELEGKVGKLKCKTLEVMKNEKQIWNSITWINHTRPVYMKYCSHDTVYHLLMNNNKGGGEGGWKERGSLERGAFKLKKKTQQEARISLEIFGTNFITHLAMVVVEGQLKTVGVGVGVVVHVLQTPEEGMVQDHLEGVGVEDHQADDEEAYL